MLPKTAFSLLSLCALATSALAAPLSPSPALAKRGGGFDSFGGGNNRNNLSLNQEDKAAAEKAKATKFNAQDESKKKAAALDFALDEDVAIFREDLHIEYVKVDADAKAKAAALAKNNNNKLNFKNENEAAAAKKKKLNVNKSNSRGGGNEFYKRQFEGDDLVDEGGLDDFSGDDFEGGADDVDLLKRGFDGESFDRDGGEGHFGGFKGRGDGFNNFAKGGDRFGSHNKFNGNSFKDGLFPGEGHFEKGHRGGYGFKGRGGYDH